MFIQIGCRFIICINAKDKFLIHFLDIVLMRGTVLWQDIEGTQKVIALKTEF